MYVLIVIGVVVVATLIVILLKRHQQRKLEAEQANGKWDYINRAFFPYLHSHPEPVEVTRELSIKCVGVSGFENYKGKLHYNAAGLLIEKTAPLSVNESLEKDAEFIFGKDTPAKFKPEFASVLTDIEKDNGHIILSLRSKEPSEKRAYQLIIKNAPGGLFEAIEKIL